MFLNIFSRVLLPLILVVSLAYLLGRLRKVNSQPLAQVAFFLFNPALAFVSLASTTVAPDLLGRLVLLKLTVLVVLVPLSHWVGKRFRLTAAASSAFVLAASFANSGNFGLSVTEYAFGKEGLALAVICFLTDNLAMNSLAIYIAARGRASVRQAAAQVVRNPALYAVILGLLTHQLGWQVPLPVWRGLETLGRAAVPVMLTVLGLQLAQMPIERHHWPAIGTASVLRLVVAPAIAALLVLPLGITGLARQVALLETAVPTAVTASIVASQFDAEPRLVAANVLISSILSLFTVTALLTWVS